MVVNWQFLLVRRFASSIFGKALTIWSGLSQSPVHVAHSAVLGAVWPLKRRRRLAGHRRTAPGMAGWRLEHCQTDFGKAVPDSSSLLTKI
jgi:hypothetical protein